MPPIDQMQLSRRERQIMDILIEHGASSAHDVQERLVDPPSYSTVRALIARLVEKKIVEFKTVGNKHIYSAKMPQEKVQNSAIKRLLKTFFRGSRVNAVNALLDMEGDGLSDREIAELERSIARIKNNKKTD